MRDRGTRFWQGPGAALLLVAFILVVGGVVALAVAGPPVLRGLVLIPVGVGAIAGAEAIADQMASVELEMRRPPMNPDDRARYAQAGRPWSRFYARLFGAILVVAGFVTAIGDLS